MSFRKILPVALVAVVVVSSVLYVHYSSKEQMASLYNIQSSSTPAPENPSSPCNLTVQALPTPAAQAIAIGTTQFDFAHIKFSAPSTCSIKLNSAQVSVLYASPSLLPGLIANIKVFNLGTNTQIGNTVAIPHPNTQNYNLFTISPNLTIPAGGSGTLSFRADTIGQYGSGEPLQFGVTNVAAVKIGTAIPVSNNIGFGVYGQGMVTNYTGLTCTTSMTYTYDRQWGGEGTANGQFKNPAGVAIGLSGNIYVVDQSNSRVEEFTSNGTYLTQWGGLGVGNGQFNVPSGIAVDPLGNVYVVDTGVHSNDYRVQKFTSNGTYIAQWGMHGGGDGHIINSVGNGIAVDRSGNVYVADSDYNRVQKFTSNGAYITQWGSFGLGDGQFESVSGITADDFGNIYTIDGEMGYTNSHHRIQKFTSNGTYVTQWSMSNTTVTGAIGYITTDSFGSVYVASQFYEVSDIQKFNPTGTALTQWGSYGFGNGQFNITNGIAVDSSGNVYVADAGGTSAHNNRIEKFTPHCPLI